MLKKQLFSNFCVKSWAYIWRGLITILSIFLFLIYLLIRRNASAYTLLIYEWPKIRMRYTFWLIINEMQPWKFNGKNRNPIFLNSVLVFSYSCSLGVWNSFIKSFTCIWFTLFPIVYEVLMVFQLDFRIIISECILTTSW